MEYSHLNKTPLKQISYDCFDGGLNTYNKEDLILDNQLSDGANLLFENGVLTSRKGLSFDLDEAVGNFDDYGRFKIGIKITDTEILRGDSIHKVAYALWGDTNSYETLYIYLVSQDKKLLHAGSFDFRRTSSDTYYKFSNIVFLVGRKNKGCGLYAFLNKESVLTQICEIYELTSSYNEWIKVEQEDLYVPIVQINGKGNKYSEAVKMGDFSLPDVAKPEKYNMLTSRFKAYFTTDGYSNVFQLPSKSLEEDSPVLCRLYISKNYYNEWLIPSGALSATILTDKGNITMHCYRNTAQIAFFDENENPFAIPQNYILGHNTLFVEAIRQEENEVSKIVTCKHCQVYNTNVFFYGNKETPASIYTTTVQNPLYFPENLKSTIGNPSDNITAMAVQNNKLIAFKSNEIYHISVKKAESELVSDSLVASDIKTFENRQISLSLVHGTIGCANKNTLSVCGNRLVWLSNDDGVYTLATTTYGKENNVYCVSSPIQNILKAYSKNDLSNAFGFTANGFYVLYIAKSLYLLNYRIKNFGISPVYEALGNYSDSISWYVLKLPNQKYHSGYSISGEINLSCSDINSKYCVLSSLEGNVDKILSFENGKALQNEVKIDSSITTKFFNFGSSTSRKIIEEVYIGMDFSGIADIILNDGNIEYKQTVFSQQKTYAPIRIAPHFKGVYGLSVTVVSNEPISFRGIAVKYKNMI